MRGILQEKGASGAKAAWLQAAGSPPAAAKRGSCPAAARQGRLNKRKRGGSCRGPAGRTRAQPRARSRGEPPRGCRRAVPERHFGAVSARCPPARRSPPGSPSRERRGPGGRSRQRSPSAAARALPAGPAPRHVRAASPRLLSTGAYPFSLHSCQRSVPPLSAAALPAGRCSRRRPEPAARCPSGAGRDARPGGGARAGGPGTDQGPNAAPGARHGWGPLSTSRARGGCAPLPHLG